MSGDIAKIETYKNMLFQSIKHLIRLGMRPEIVRKSITLAYTLAIQEQEGST